jgi:hypothetical protein
MKIPLFLIRVAGDGDDGDDERIQREPTTDEDNVDVDSRSRQAVGREGQSAPSS